MRILTWLILLSVAHRMRANTRQTPWNATDENVLNVLHCRDRRAQTATLPLALRRSWCRRRCLAFWFFWSGFDGGYRLAVVEKYFTLMLAKHVRLFTFLPRSTKTDGWWMNPPGHSFDALSMSLLSMATATVKAMWFPQEDRCFSPC